MQKLPPFSISNPREKNGFDKKKKYENLCNCIASTMMFLFLSIFKFLKNVSLLAELKIDISRYAIKEWTSFFVNWLLSKWCICILKYGSMLRAISCRYYMYNYSASLIIQSFFWKLEMKKTNWKKNCLVSFFIKMF